MASIALVVIVALGILALFGVALIYGTFAWGYVLQCSWAWLIMANFPEAPGLSFVQCCAIWFVSCVFRSTQPTKTEGKDDAIKNLTTTLLAPWMSLLMAYFMAWVLS